MPIASYLLIQRIEDIQALIIEMRETLDMVDTLNKITREQVTQGCIKSVSREQLKRAS